MGRLGSGGCRSAGKENQVQVGRLEEAVLPRLPGRRGRQDLGQKRHALHGSHGDVQGPRYVHGHWGGDGDRVGDVHGRRGGDVDRGDVDRPRDRDWVLQAHRRGDVHRVGGDVHLRGNGDWVAGVAAVHHRGNRGRDSDGRGGGRVADFVAVFSQP